MAAELRPRCGQMNGALNASRNYAALTTIILSEVQAAVDRSLIYLDLVGSGQSPRQRKRSWEAGMVRAAVRNREGVALDCAVLDRAHLARMTLNDCGLEREILQLFDRQAELLMERMRGSKPAAIATLAHTLKGSAVGIGAARVARAAAATELAASCALGECSGAIDQLSQAVDEVRVEIAALQRIG